MAVTSYRFVGTEVSWDDNSDGGGGAWSPTGNAGADDSTYSVSSNYALAMPGGTTREVLRCTNFGFTTGDVPSGATIDGVEVVIEAKGVGLAFTDDIVQLIKANAYTGTDKGTNSNTFANGTDTAFTYGGASDLWGATLSDTDVIDSQFGVAFNPAAVGFAMGTLTCNVDYVKMRIYYTVGGGGTPKSPYIEFQMICDSITTQRFYES